MVMSNTATPTYYGQFREKVRNGEIPISKEVEMEMWRTDALIANPNYYYDDRAIEGFILYCENELTLTDGSDLMLLDTFKLWAESLLAWFYYDTKSVYVRNEDNKGGHWVEKRYKKRLRRKQYLIVARGAAKSMYATCIQAYFLNIDTATTMQITTAPTMRQADEVLAPFKTAITRAKGPLFKWLTQGSLQNTTGNPMNRVKLASTKKGIMNFLTGSRLEVLPMSIDKLQGYRSKVNTIDEWLSGDVREDVVAALEQGAAKGGLDDYIIVAMSSEGTVRNGPGDTIKMELTDILRGDYLADHVSIWWYKLDKVEEVNQPDMWLKAQPNLPHTVTYETYHQDVERAEKVPAQVNDILAKRFGIPMEGYTYFFSFEDTELNGRRSMYTGMYCTMGVDLSKGDDFTAFTFLFPLGDGAFGIKTRSYISSVTMAKLPGAMFAKYQAFINEGTLHVFEGAYLDMMTVYEDLEKYILRNKWEVRAVGFDPYGATEFMTRWEQENGPYGLEKVQQGARTESIPLGELKNHFEEKLMLFDETIMSFTLGNAVTLEDTNGNRKLLKKHHEAKIDNVSALIDAWVAYKLNKDEF